MIRYAISDRRLFGGDATAQMAGVVGQAARLGAAGVEFFQVREKDLPVAELAALVRAVCDLRSGMRVLVNGSVQAGADGMHLPGAMAELMVPRGMVVSVACHSVEEVRRAVELERDLILFGPVFGKTVAGEDVVGGVGLERLHAACAAAGGVPVLALGGVTAESAAACVDAGAAGVAGIRMFL